MRCPTNQRGRVALVSAVKTLAWEGWMSRGEVKFTLAILLTIVVLLVGVLYSLFAISVNSGRIDQLLSLESQMQAKAAAIAKDPHASNVDALQSDLANLSRDRDLCEAKLTMARVAHGSYTISHCILPLDANSVHRNASEMNNLYLAMASGALGASFFASGLSRSSNLQSTGSK